MATIRTRRRKDGSLAYLSEIRVKRGGVLIHRESKTFDRLGQARTWAATREKRLAKVEPVRRPTRTLANTRLAKILQKYRREVSELRPMGRSKASHIRFLEKTQTARMQVSDTLPLDRDGRIGCVTCHEAHMSSGLVPRRLRAKGTALCRGCHP